MNEQPKHTRGPWRVSGARMVTPNGNPHALIEYGGTDTFDPLIAEVYGPTGDKSDLNLAANAALIATAPELLAALARLVEVVTSGEIAEHLPVNPESLKSVQAARAVLAKAVRS